MSDTHSNEHWHRRLIEGRGALMAVLTVVLILVGTVIEIVPVLLADIDQAQTTHVKPYTALEVAGRDIYIREGCYVCHSQHVRPFRSETLRYGTWSSSEEYTWDRPFQLGSRRIGPDLHRVGFNPDRGGPKYPNSWHYRHMKDPRSTSPGSVMPPYPWLYDAKVDPVDIQASLWALKMAGTPYTDADLAGVADSMKSEGQAIVDDLSASDIKAAHDDEIVALIAYLQSLGRNQRTSKKTAEATP